MSHPDPSAAPPAAAPSTDVAASELARRKAELRRAVAACRLGQDPSLGRILGMHLLATCPPPPGAVVAGFLPIQDEIDITPLLAALHARGHVIGLPVTPPRGHPLTFHRWTPDVSLLPGRFGTRYPDAPPVVPDVLLVPLLAFDRACRRLGYGGGYYDRTLAALPAAQAIGCAYAAQEIDAVPTAPTDITLHAIATERGVIRPEAA